MRNWNRKTSSSKLSSVSISFSTAAKGNFNHNRRTNSKVPEMWIQLELHSIKF